MPRALSSSRTSTPPPSATIELLRPMHTDDEGGTLLRFLIKRVLQWGAAPRAWITHPLKRPGSIQEPGSTASAGSSRTSLPRARRKLFLRQIADIEHLVGRVTYERANGRDVTALARSIEVFPKMSQAYPRLPMRALGAADEGVTSRLNHRRIAVTRAIVVSAARCRSEERGLVKTGVSGRT